MHFIGVMRLYLSMKVMIFGLLAFVLASLTWVNSAVASDTFGTATVISGSGVLTGTNAGATGETGEYVGAFPAGSGAPLNSIWYSWTAPASGVVSFGTCNPTGSSLTNFDTTIVVGTGTAVNAFTVIAENDDTTGCNSVVNASYGSTVIFNAVSGTTYRIQVDGYGNTVGTFQLFYGFSGYTTVASNAQTSEAGATSSFTVVLNAVPSAPATITIGTSPQCTFSPSVLNFTSANWATPQTVTVTAINDTVMEGNHFCAPSSLTPAGGGVVGSSQPPPTFTVVDNDTTVNIANTTNGAEAGPVNGVLTVTQGGTLSVANTITYTVAGTATSGADYTALSGTVTIPAGATSATITIPVIDDAIVEANETVQITLTGASSSLAVLGTTAATNTIASNDTATVSITRTTNGNEAGPVSAVFTVTQTNVSSTATVINLTRSGTATVTNDYTSPGNTITIPAGATTATITYPVVNDATVEGDETLIVTMSSIASGLATLGAPVAATATLFDNDSPTVTIANTINGTETGPTSGTMTLTLSAVRPTIVTVAYTVTGTATSGADFTTLSGTINIPAGALTATLTIPVINDTNVENSETVVVTLTSVTSGAATIGATVVATNTITDNDSATVTIANTTNGAEAGPANGVITITQSAVSAANTVLAYTVSGTATSGTDYTALSGTVTILAGSTTAVISIPVIDDSLFDPAETVIVSLTGVTSGLNTTLGATVIATNTITENDVATPVLQITKLANPPGPVALGDTITYTFLVKNTGNVAINSVTVIETAFSGAGIAPVPGSEVLFDDVTPTGDSTDATANNNSWSVLGPGDTVQYMADYVVVQTDIDNQ